MAMGNIYAGWRAFETCRGGRAYWNAEKPLSGLFDEAVLYKSPCLGVTCRLVRAQINPAVKTSLGNAQMTGLCNSGKYISGVGIGDQISGL